MTDSDGIYHNHSSATICNMPASHSCMQLPYRKKEENICGERGRMLEIVEINRVGKGFHSMGGKRRLEIGGTTDL